MSRIKGKNTSPEMIVRSLLHNLGYRFRLHVKKLPGKPDIVMKKHSTIIFVHGCFWHRHPDCKFATTPKSNTRFWMEKFRKNQERDAVTQQTLDSMGWRVLIVWECETKDTVRLAEKLVDILK